LESAHPEVYSTTIRYAEKKKKETDETVDDSGDDSGHEGKRQNEDIDRDEYLASLITDFIVDQNLPFRLAEAATFRRILNFLGGELRLPNRHQISQELIPKLAAETCSTIKGPLLGQKLALTMDTWSYRHHSLLR
jgi:hypothetical protein